MGFSRAGRRWASAALAGAAATVAGCAARQTAPEAPAPERPSAAPARAPSDDGPSASGAEERSPEWRALFPEQNAGAVRSDSWSGAPILQIGGRDYASALPADEQRCLGLAFAPLALRRGETSGLSWAIVGAGSGYETLVAVSSEPERVDLYEPRRELHELAREVARGGRESLRLDRGLLDPEQNEALTVRTAPRAGRPPSYDVIVHSAGLAVISEPRRLFRRERLESLAGLLEPGGRLVMDLPLREIDEELLGSLLRTFAAAFEHVVVLAPYPEATNAFVVGARDPLSFDLPTLRALCGSDPGRALCSAVYAERAEEVASRVLFASREEVLDFAGDGPVYTEEEPLGADELPLPPAMEVAEPTEADAERWRRAYEQQMARYGFSQDFHERFYEPGWRYGHPCPEPPRCGLVSGVGEGTDAARALGELALARFLWNGSDEARLFAAARQAAGTRGPTRPERVHALLTDEGDPPFRAREWGARGPLRRELIGLERELDRERWSEAAGHVTELLRERRLPVELISLAELWWAYASFRDGADGALASFGGTVRSSPSLLLDHPEALLLLGRMRARDGARFDAARTLEAYLELSERLAGGRGGSR